MNTTEKILKYIQDREQASGSELAHHLDMTDRAIRKQLKALFEDGQLTKIGKPPRVYYRLSEAIVQLPVVVSNAEKQIISEQFLYISPQGERVDGLDGFVLWCKRRGFDITQKTKEYKEIFRKYEHLKKQGLISGKKKMTDTFAQNFCLEDVLYADFYAWEVFGKTKLGQLLLSAKQSQDRKLMKEVVEHIRASVEQLVQDKSIQAVGFIPPTVKRQIQFMNVLKESLALALPEVKMVKIQTEVITPQKTLTKLSDRIENAESTIVVTEKLQYTNVLLIDDAVGSGATLNQVACKLRRMGVAQKVYGFAVTGSVKGFDIISEV